MEFENMNINEVEEVANVLEEVVPEKTFKLSAGCKGLIVGTLVTAGLVGLVAVVKKVRGKKAAEQEEEEVCDNSEEDVCDDPYDYPEDSDVEDK